MQNLRGKVLIGRVAMQALWQGARALGTGKAEFPQAQPGASSRTACTGQWEAGEEGWAGRAGCEMQGRWG